MKEFVEFDKVDLLGIGLAYMFAWMKNGVPEQFNKLPKERLMVYLSLLEKSLAENSRRNFVQEGWELSDIWLNYLEMFEKELSQKH